MPEVSISIIIMALSKPARDYDELEGAAISLLLIPDPEITVSSVTTPSLRPAVTLPMEEDRRGNVKRAAHLTYIEQCVLLKTRSVLIEGMFFLYSSSLSDTEICETNHATPEESPELVGGRVW